MKDSITYHIVNSEATYMIETIDNSCTDNSIQFKLTVFSWDNSVFDANFKYRTSQNSEWKTDAVLSCSNSFAVVGNKIVGLDSSKYGVPCVFSWSFSENNIVNGQDCDIKIDLVKQPSVLSYSRNSTFIETVSANFFNNVESIDAFVVNKNYYGNEICIGTNRVFGLDDYKRIDWSITVADPVFAVQKQSGNVIVLHDNGNTLTEFDLNNVLINTFSDAIHFLNATKFEYNKYLDTVLIAGGNCHYISEFSWGDWNFSQLLWTHGNGFSSNNIKRVNSPQDAIYQPDDYNTILIADTNNNRVLSVNRNTNMIVPIENFIVSGKTVSLQKPYRLSYCNQNLIVTERQQKTQSYGTTENTHAGIVRYVSATRPITVNNENSVPAYQNLLFTPLQRTIF